MTDIQALYRSIPKVDMLLETEKMQMLQQRYGREALLFVIRDEIDNIRRSIADTHNNSTESVRGEIDALDANVEAALAQMHMPRMRRVINATGTILHTNLGRAVLAEETAMDAARLIGRYSNLEFNLEQGERGERYAHFEGLLCRLTGAEAAMVVNNNAAAVLLALSSLCRGKEVIVSRGELVEIGGKFRVPDVCAQSGASLTEVGTTNKTHYEDYEDAFTESTGAILKVHKSNFAVVGFSEEVSLEELKTLAQDKNVPLIEDLGSGSLVDLSRFGLKHAEPTVQESIEKGADVVCFSGDKLLGGPQAGIIIGKREYIARMKKHPLTRALRVDKFTVSALELTLLSYLDPDKVCEKIPVLKMIAGTKGEMETKAAQLLEMLKETCPAAEISVADCVSQIGGGALPLEELKSNCVVIRPLKITTAALEEKMRQFSVPVICRALDDTVRLDVRTIFDDELPVIAGQLKEVLS